MERGGHGVDPRPENRGDVTILSWVGETRVARKEEPQIGRRVEAETVPVAMRRQRAEGERLAPDAPNPKEEITP